MNRIRSASRAAAIMFAIAMAAAACGSTVPKSAFSQGGAPGSLSANGAGSGLSLPAGQGGSIGAGGSTPGSTGLPTGPGNLGSTPTGAGGLTIAAPGVTDSAIYVGGYYTKNQGTANAGIGAGGLDQGDARDPYNVVIDDLNARGGLLGRKVVPIYYGYDAASAVTADQQDQQACAKWTQDNKVFVILLGDAIIDECAKRAGAIEFGGTGAANDATPETYQQYPHRVDIDSMNVVRMGPVTVNGLFDHGYFGGRPRIGMVTWDDSHYKESIDKGFAATLQQHGLKFSIPTAYLAVPQTPQDLARASADVSAAVLRFKAQRIDHVMILDGPAGLCGGACITLEWLKQANSQQYFPRYGFNDTNGASVLYDMKLATKRQVEGSLSVGWLDLDNTYDVGWHPNPTREKCYALMRKHGIDMSNSNSQGAALGACLEIWFLEMAVKRMGTTITADAFMRAVETLGYSYTAPSSWANYLSPTRHDGAAGVRISAFNDGCNCFKYLTTPYRV